MRIPLALLLFTAASTPAQVPAWTQIAGTPGLLRLDQRFEMGAPVEIPLTDWKPLVHGQAAAVNLAVEPSGGPDGSPALRVDYEFKGPEGLEYVDVGIGLALTDPDPRQGVAVLLRGGVGLPLRARVTDASGEVHQFDVICAGEGEWRRAVFTLGQRSHAWSGDGNGRLDYPCTLQSVLFDRTGAGYRAKGSLWLADVRRARPRERLVEPVFEVQGARFGNLYRPGETVRLRARGQGSSLRWRWADLWGHTIAEGNGPSNGVEMPLALAEPGYFACTVEIMQAETASGTGVFRCAVLPPAAPDAPVNDVVGFTCHFGQNLNYPLACMDLLHDYGIRLFRDEIAWGSVETEPGKHALPPHGVAFTQRARELGMRPLIILDYANRLYDQGGFPNSDAAIRGFTDYSVFLATALKGTVDWFEVWNEWIGGCGMSGRPGDHGPEAYGRLLKVTGPALKAARPDATVIGIGGEYGGDLQANLDRMARTAGPGSMDAFSIHPYRYPRTPEASGLLAELQQVADRMAATGTPRRQWITEIGWPTHTTSAGVDDLTQARLLVRALALMQASGAVEKVFLYDFRNDGTQLDYNEHNFGVVWHHSQNCAPKPAAVAVATYARLTAGAKDFRLHQNGDTFAVTCRLPGDDLLIAWLTTGEGTLPVAGQIREQTDLVGRASAGANPVAISPSPVFLRGRNLAVTLP